jgi:ankyrin repeat protein
LDYLNQIFKEDNAIELQKEIDTHPLLLDSIDRNGWSMLVRAVSYRACQCILTLVRNGSNINETNQDDISLLNFAAINRNISVAEFLLHQGVVVSYRNRNSGSAFETAMSIPGNSEKWLDLFGLYQEQLDEKDLALYHEERCKYIVMKNLHKELEKEIERDSNLVFLSSKRDWNLLMTAAAYDAYECILLLLEHGADIDSVNNRGLTALMLAIDCSSLKSAQILLKQGANACIRDYAGKSAFEMAFAIYQRLNRTQWFDLFLPYADQLDERDTLLFHNNRLTTLFV